MNRFLAAAIILGASFQSSAADDLKVSQLEQDVRTLQREVQAQARQIEQLRLQLAHPEQPRAQVPAAAPATTAGQWVDNSRWQRVQPGMGEFAVIDLLGPPTSMRTREQERVLLYAMEIGASGFLSGSVTLRDRVVTVVERPVLK